MATQISTQLNGVDLERLVATVQAVKANPDLAKFSFRARSEWTGGGSSRSIIQGFYGAGQEDSSRSRPFTLLGDEPPVLLGNNTAPNAVETVLHALAACLAVGFAYNAAVQGITIESLEFELEGELDLHGFLGLSEETRAGCDSIRVTYRVKSDAPRGRILELCEYVQKTSPVLDIVRNPVPVSIQLAE
jgi:uncharacterized OsmC-like protein